MDIDDLLRRVRNKALSAGVTISGQPFGWRSLQTLSKQNDVRWEPNQVPHVMPNMGASRVLHIVQVGTAVSLQRRNAVLSPPCSRRLSLRRLSPYDVSRTKLERLPAEGQG